ncbi:hypothetical protein HOY34_06780 [Xinfangfangia sp. D13-10-4-6]|nr:hypothetical protein [Pseudogemmobacter hezensis]
MKPLRATLEINLAVIAENYRHLREVYGGPVYAVLKRDAYQLGLRRIAPLLAQAGAPGFFVETLAEARLLKTALQRAGNWPCEVYVLTGFGGHPPRAFAQSGLIPMLSTRQEVRLAAGWPGLEVGLILETGLGRPGLTPADIEASASVLAQLRIRHVMSHLADMNQPEAPRNQAQRAAFLRMATAFPKAGTSLASSAFAFAGPAWRIGAARRGQAARSLAPAMSKTPPIRPAPPQECWRLFWRSRPIRQVRFWATAGFGWPATAGSRASPLAMPMACPRPSGKTRHSCGSRGRTARYCRIFR